jgi:hypothetical protein
MTDTQYGGSTTSKLERGESGLAIMNTVTTQTCSLDTESVNPLADPSWDRDVASHPESTLFHTAAWARVLSGTYGHEPVYLRFSNNGKLTALLPLMEVRSLVTGCRGICLPFTDFCGPLVFGGGNADFVLPELLALARRRKWKYFEIRERKMLEPSATAAVTFLGHSLDLRGSEEDRLGRLKSSARRDIRKAERNEVKIEVTRTREAVLEYYRLHTQTRKKHGLPPQPLSFFSNIYEHVIKTGGGFIVMARIDSRPVAGNVYFVFGKRAVHKFGASDENAQEGSKLVMWEGIRYLAQNGAESLHFGRTSVANEGLRRYKLRWGTKEEQIEYIKFDSAAGEWAVSRDSAAGVHNSVFRRLPLSVNRFAGALIYPHLD